MLRGNKCIGIVKEIYSKWERRSPLTPKHVKQLVEQHGLRVLVPNPPSLQSVGCNCGLLAGATIQ